MNLSIGILGDASFGAPTHCRTYGANFGVASVHDAGVALKPSAQPSHLAVSGACVQSSSEILAERAKGYQEPGPGRDLMHANHAIHDVK